MTRYEKLLNRRTDPDIALKAFSANEAYRVVEEGENVKYALGAMQPIDPEYTANTFKQCERVENQLQTAFDGEGAGVDFDHQGSTTNDTHVRAKSDIDLLTAVRRFTTIQLPNRPEYPYPGDPIADLRHARRVTVAKLKAAFPTAEIDSSGGKSVKVKGGSLTREIDVVSCAWWHTVEYVQTKDKKYLGIGVLDNERGAEVFNKPFLHNDRIEHRDNATQGHTRRVTRLLKSLKYDSEGKVSLSSYDIAGIAYNMYDHLLASVPEGREILLLEKADQWLNVLEYGAGVRTDIMVPNGTRKVFGPDGATLAGLQQLRKELADLIVAVNREVNSARRKLEEIVFPNTRPYRPPYLEPAYRLR